MYSTVLPFGPASARAGADPPERLITVAAAIARAAVTLVNPSFICSSFGCRAFVFHFLFGLGTRGRPSRVGRRVAPANWRVLVLCVVPIRGCWRAAEGRPRDSCGDRHLVLPLRR